MRDKQGVPGHFIKVGRGAYLSKHDPRFLEKYIHYFPEDGQKLYEYASLLSSQGKHKQAQQYYRRAALHGYFGGVSTAAITKTDHEEEEKKDSKQAWASALLWINVLLLVILLVFVGNVLLTELAGGKHSVLSLKSIEAEETIEEEPAVIGEKYPLALIAVNQAIQSYADMKGYYPKDLQHLKGSYPDNWVSILPADVFYNRRENDYELTWRGEDVSHLLPSLQLTFYEGNNQLVLMAGEEVVRVYPVASGREPLTFSSSAVTERVVNPNGGTGVLGTRGLVLHDNYAIHGTNQPELIGERVSKGCLRLLNEDIEELYPYIPIGTPLTVEKGKFIGEPSMLKGLPAFSSPLLAHEQTNLKWFKWRQ
ncbi:L,D-transpeptidase family protein [Bacillus tianshenii]|nr:L,D-transpeptidase family protein [Bacillus tianshenii]